MSKLVVDYRERRQIIKNSPKQRGPVLFSKALAAAMMAVFLLGFLSGWLVCKRTRLLAPANPVVSGATGKESATATPPVTPPATGVAGGIEPALTFYETLSKGGKAVIGTGINSPRHGEKPVVGNRVQPTADGGTSQSTFNQKSQPENVTSRQPNAPIKAGEQTKSSESVQTSQKEVGVKGKFSVQIASFREKREAEILRDKLVGMGSSAYLLESHVKDKGVWYRIRIGHMLEQKEANEMAQKAGMGAIVIPE